MTRPPTTVSSSSWSRAWPSQGAAFGVGPVSLNFAMFREAFERGAEVGAGPVARLWRQGLLLASKTWQLESLYRSNAKYLPEWQPRYMGYEFASDLPRVGTAAGSAEGFLTKPSISLLPQQERGASDAARHRRRGARRGRAGPDPAGARRGGRGPVDRAPPRADAGTPGQARPAPRAGHRPLPRHLPAHPHPGAGARRVRRAARPTRCRGAPSRSPAGSCSSATWARSASAPCATAAATCRCMVDADPGRDRGAPTSGRTASTSATTSASPAR